MKNIIIIIAILIISVSILYIFNLENDNQKIVNNSSDNSSNIQIDNLSDKNVVININSTEDINKNLDNSNYEKSFNKNKKSEYVFNNSSDEALEAKRGVEKYVLDKNEIAGYPIYKDSRLDSWLVPIFDKKTKKFKGSVYIYNGGEAFVLGPQSYLEYKNIVNGGKSHKSDLSNGVKNNHSKWDVLNSSKIIRNVVVEGKLNKYFSNSNNVYSRVDVDLNEYSNLDFDSYPSINESS